MNYVENIEDFIGIPFAHKILTYMSDWFTKNAWSLLIAAIALAGNYAVYGYRLDDLDKRTTANAASIAALSDNNLQVQVALAKIQTDIEYIKLQVTHNNSN